jgi:hypothetical protein
MGATAQWTSSFAGCGDGGDGGNGRDGRDGRDCVTEAMAARWLRLAKRERGTAGAREGGGETGPNNGCGGDGQEALGTAIRGTTRPWGDKVHRG